MTNISNFSYSILVNDKPIRTFGHKGLTYVEARPNQEYTIKVRNDRSSRVLLVTSIDSLNVLDGKVNSEAGYIVNGNSNVEIKGFRVDENTVNAFKFVSKDKSYAAKSDETNGDTQNCGVIGFRIFEEKQPLIPYKITIENHPHYHPHYLPYYTPYPPYYNPCQTWCGTGKAIGSAGVQGDAGEGYPASSILRSCSLSSYSKELPEPFNMGTEFSSKTVEFKIETIQFEKGNLIEEFSIYYTNREGLIKLGVPIEKKNEVVFPQAFPRFCKPPKN